MCIQSKYFQCLSLVYSHILYLFFLGKRKPTTPRTGIVLHWTWNTYYTYLLYLFCTSIPKWLTCFRWRRWSWRVVQSWRLMLLSQELVISLLLSQSSFSFPGLDTQKDIVWGHLNVSFLHICIGVCTRVFIATPAGLFVNLPSDLYKPFCLKLMQQPFFPRVSFFCIHCISEHFYLYVFFRRNPQYWLLERQQTGSWFKESFGCWQGDLCWQLNYLLHYIIITLISTIFSLRSVYQFYEACVFWF